MFTYVGDSTLETLEATHLPGTSPAPSAKYGHTHLEELAALAERRPPGRDPAVQRRRPQPPSLPASAATTGARDDCVKPPSLAKHPSTKTGGAPASGRGVYTIIMLGSITARAA